MSKASEQQHTFAQDGGDNLLCAKCGEHVLDHGDVAQQIVDYVLDYVAVAGRIEGRRGNKIVTLPMLVNMQTGAPMGTVYDAMVTAVRDMIDGKSGYRRKADASPASLSEAKPS
ncbi:MAG TPA: hypothetical protein VEA38_08500 [Terriglobales bacterium]|nr:hypothetical protein [Terriglobales bacterium]